MPTTERFTHREVIRILGVTEKQLAYWERLGFARPRARWGEKFYGFGDLISVRAVKQLTDQRVPARRLRRAVEALQGQLADIKTPLTELRILSNGREIVVEHEGARVEPLSGQLVLNFDTRELSEKVRAMPERGPEEWFGLALALESAKENRAQAVEAYQHALAKKPDWVEARLNLGALLYEQGSPRDAAHHFACAVQTAPASAMARFNLASALDELGEPAEAHRHLREAVKLDPDFADGHYNLAVVAEKLGRRVEARQHWRRYLELEPSSKWAAYARERLSRDPH